MARRPSAWPLCGAASSTSAHANDRLRPRRLARRSGNSRSTTATSTGADAASACDAPSSSAAATEPSPAQSIVVRAGRARRDRPVAERRVVHRVVEQRRRQRRVGARERGERLVEHLAVAVRRREHRAPSARARPHRSAVAASPATAIAQRDAALTRRRSVTGSARTSRRRRDGTSRHGAAAGEDVARLGPSREPGAEHADAADRDACSCGAEHQRAVAAAEAERVAHRAAHRGAIASRVSMRHGTAGSTRSPPRLPGIVPPAIASSGEQRLDDARRAERVAGPALGRAARHVAAERPPRPRSPSAASLAGVPVPCRLT